jgi:dihydroxy-acid dehydratase
MVYGGSIHSGKWKGESLNIVSAFEALGKNSITRLLLRDFKGVFKTLVLGRSLWRNVYCKYHVFSYQARDEFAL